MLAKFGTRGSEAAQLAGPHYAAINSHANIIISDFHNHNIKVNIKTNKNLHYTNIVFRFSQKMVTSFSALDQMVNIGNP